MQKKFYITTFISLAIFMTALIILTPYDLKISENIYQKGIWIDQFLEVIGPAFMPFFVFYSTVSLMCLLKVKNKVGQIFTYIGLGFVYVYAFFMGCFTFKHSYCPVLFIPSIVIYVLFTVLVVLLNLKLFKQNDKTNAHLKICFVILIICLTSLLLTDIIKLIFSRARYHEILAGEAAYHPWYYLTGRLVLNSSFPSGHVTRAGTALCFACLLFYKQRKKVTLIIVEALASIFTIVVGISRIIEGMHFATDVLTGYYLICLSYYLSKRFLLEKIKV